MKVFHALMAIAMAAYAGAILLMIVGNPQAAALSFALVGIPTVLILGAIPVSRWWTWKVIERQARRNRKAHR